MSWRGEISLNYSLVGERLRYSCRHQGPLTVQKPFVSPDQRSLHHYILHPPGGLVGLDELHTQVGIKGSPLILLTSPSAQKVYRSTHKPALVRSHSEIHDDGVFAWLPQETILFGGSHYRSHNHFHLSPEASLVYWDTFVFGRPSIGETLGEASLQNRLIIDVDGKPMVNDGFRLAAGDDLLESPLGLGAQTCYGQLYICGPQVSAWAAKLDHSRHGHSSWTAYDNVFSARILGSHAYDLRDWLHVFVESFFAYSAIHSYQQPRIWAC